MLLLEHIVPTRPGKLWSVRITSGVIRICLRIRSHKLPTGVDKELPFFDFRFTVRLERIHRRV